ncbi:MAG: hypothetical protein QM496_04050 [Verrucomicrobiota bacterium]
MSILVQVNCPKCYWRVPDEWMQQHSDQASCPACRASLFIKSYARLRADPDSLRESPISVQALSGEGDAVCRFYPDLKAEAVCDECGCFLSKKAALSWGGRDLCMPCLHTLREGKGKDEFLAKRVLYDNSALALILFLSPFSLFTAPMALYYLIRYRKSSRGIVPRSAFRWWLAMILSIAFSLGWLALLVLWVAAIVDSIG